MQKVKIEDYKKEMVCYFNDLGDLVVIESDDVREIKDIISKGYIVYGTISEKVFKRSFIDDVRDMCRDTADEYGYEEMNEFIDYESDEFKKIETSIKEWIESLGNSNNVYYADKDTIITI